MSRRDDALIDRAVQFANATPNPRNTMRYARPVYEPNAEEIESAKRELLSKLEPSRQKDFLEAKANDPNYEHPDGDWETICGPVGTWVKKAYRRS